MSFAPIAAVLAPFALAAAAPVARRVMGKWAAWALALGPAAIAAWLISILPEVSRGEAVTASWAWAPALDVALSIRIDGLSLLFALLISGVGALILVYAGGYLEGHPRVGSMHGLLLFFMGSMLGLVTADNLFALFVFWELTSVSSFLLIGFDRERAVARAAALQALIVTAVGGLALLAAFILMGLAANSFELSTVLSDPAVIRNNPHAPAILILLALGAFTKSAQFPFHFWLPNAMEAPTPVSAYLHSSTMVKAGVYLLARVSPLYSGTAEWTWLLLIAGLATMLIGAYLAFRATALKRMLAYTTVSSLGTMVALLGVGGKAGPFAAVAYLLAHACFKGALFMVAGAIDHETEERDSERLGGLARAMPITAAASGLAALSMVGLFPFLGFVAKEEVIAALRLSPAANAALAVFLVGAVIAFVPAIAAGIKPFFLGMPGPTPRDPHEPPLSLLLGPVVLALAGVALGAAPGLLAEPLVGGAAKAIAAAEIGRHLALWHGWSPDLALSLASTALGLLLFAWRAPVRRVAAAAGVFERLGPARWYDWTLEAICVVSRFVTKAIQGGHLRIYLRVTMVVIVLLVALALVNRVNLGEVRIALDARPHEIGLAALILAGAAMAVTTRSRLTAVAGLGLAGYGVALVFVFFGAPDLAITQVAVETLSVILFVLVFYRLPDFRTMTGRFVKVRDFAVALTGGLAAGALALLGATTEIAPPISTWYAEHSAALAHGRNVVNVILVDFRGFDTLGEITVLGVAAIGVFALIKLRIPEEENA